MISCPATDFAYLVGRVSKKEPMDAAMFAHRPDAPVFCVQSAIHGVESLSLPNPLFCVQTEVEKGVSCRPERATWILTDDVAMKENTFGFKSLLVVKRSELKRDAGGQGGIDATGLAVKAMLDIGIRRVCPHGVEDGFAVRHARTLEICGMDGNGKCQTPGNACPGGTPIDYIIPLGKGSRSKNDELRILLRSLEKNAYNLGRVIIVSQCAPDWLRNVIVVPMNDILPHNKDGNIISKILAGIRTVGINGEFVWSADDLVLVRPLDLATLPPIYNRNGRTHFVEEAKKPKHRWHERMVRTFDLAAELKLKLECNYEAHTMQRLNANELLNAISTIDYESGLGYGIMSLFAMLTGRMGGEPQERWKTCHETEESAKADFGCVPFVQYNDKSFLNGLRSRLFQAFPMKSKYEI